MLAQNLVREIQEIMDTELDGPNLPVRVYGTGEPQGTVVNRDDYGVAYEIVLLGR